MNTTILAQVIQLNHLKSVLHLYIFTFILRNKESLSDSIAYAFILKMETRAVLDSCGRVLTVILAIWAHCKPAAGAF